MWKKSVAWLSAFSNSLSHAKGCSILALAFLLSVHASQAANYAGFVVDYHPGAGFATEFGSGLGYTLPESALGEPSRLTQDPHPTFGGTFSVNPFNPPYLRDQLVSIGEGGWLTVGFEHPIWNSPAHPFGLDFLIFGNSGFVITNGDFSGGGITDGSLFAASPGSTRVSVSADNISWFQLDLALAPTVDQLFPTDGSGDFSLPVNPALSEKDFAGLNLAGIRSRYAGSGGGAGFDISWARDEQGAAVDLPHIRYIRVDVVSGASEIDGFAAVPEPSSWMLAGIGAMAFVFRKRLFRACTPGKCRAARSAAVSAGRKRS